MYGSSELQRSQFQPLYPYGLRRFFCKEKTRAGACPVYYNEGDFSQRNWRSFKESTMNMLRQCSLTAPAHPWSHRIAMNVRFAWEAMPFDRRKPVCIGFEWICIARLAKPAEWIRANVCFTTGGALFCNSWLYKTGVKTGTFVTWLKQALFQGSGGHIPCMIIHENAWNDRKNE